MRTITRALSIVSIAAAVGAAPAPALGRDFGVRTDGRMAVRGIPDPVARLPGTDRGWTLALELPGDGSRCSVELRDVSPIPGHLLKWVEALPAGERSTVVRLDPRRYLPAHTYRLALRCGTRELQRAYVHLLAPAAAAARVRLDLDGAAPGHDDGSDDDAEITSVPKGEL